MVLYLPEERSEDLSVGLGPALLNEPCPQEVVGVHELLPGELFVTEGRWDWGDWTWQCGARVGCHCCKSSSRSSVHALQHPKLAPFLMSYYNFLPFVLPSIEFPVYSICIYTHPRAFAHTQAAIYPRSFSRTRAPFFLQSSLCWRQPCSVEYQRGIHSNFLNFCMA